MPCPPEKDWGEGKFFRKEAKINAKRSDTWLITFASSW